MRITYSTAQTPFGRQETFILTEITTAIKLGAKIVIIPRNPSREIFHDQAKSLVEHTLHLPLINCNILLVFIKELVTTPRTWKILWCIFTHSRSFKILIKNLAILPKAVFIAQQLNKSDVKHIHAHWASTTATMAWAVSELTGIPWSFTLHRWDIAENNMLRLKVEKACFARCIAEDGRNEVLEIIGKDLGQKVRVLHLGVPIPEEKAGRRIDEHLFTIACPATFVPIKGHKYLVEACAKLVKRGITEFQVLLFGDGPLEDEIRGEIRRLGLQEFIKLLGRLPHEQLIQWYSTGSVDAVVLTSVETEIGEKEGIPVALMEAMAWGIPVVTTETGGTHELAGGGAALIVPQRDSGRLTEAIESLIKDQELAGRLAEAGQRRVSEQFNIVENTKTLLKWIEECSS